MREVPVNCPGTGGMQVFQARKAFEGVAAGEEVVLTSGEDGTVCFTNLSQQQKLDKVSKALTIDGFIPSIAVVPEQTHLLLINEDESALYSYTLPPFADIKMDQCLFRSTVQLRQVVCCAKYIALASEDPQIKLLARNNTELVLSIDGHHQAIRSIAFSANQKYLCSTSDDATFRVVELSEQPEFAAQEVLKLSLEHGETARDDMNCGGAWNPVENTRFDLAVPLRKDTIALYSNDGPHASWVSSRQLKIPLGSGVSSYLNTLAFSPDGKHLAAASYAKQIFVWNVESGECLHTWRIDGDHQVLSLQWSPSQYTLVAHHTGGKIAILKDIVTRSTTLLQSSATNNSESETSRSSSSKQVLKRLQTPVAETKEPTKKDEKNEEEDDDDDEPEARVEAIKASFGFGSTKSHEQPPLATSLHANRAMMMMNSSLDTGISSLKSRQEPFQPGFAVDGNVRLLAWTPLGEIESIPGVDDHENLVKVDFHDKSRRGFKFNDAYCFNMAFLDEHGALFASPRRLRNAWESPVAATTSGGDATDVVASFVFYRPFESWASNSSWHLELHPSEQAEAVACAKSFCAVATSLHVIRLYLTSALEFACLRLPNRVVTMTARDNLLAVIVQDAFPFLNYQLYQIQFEQDTTSPVRLVSQGRFPLSPPLDEPGHASSSSSSATREDVTKWSRLEWLGFDDKNLLYAVDSFGIVQLLNVQTNGWVPVANLGGDLSLRTAEFADEQLELADGTTLLRSQKRNVFVLGIVNDTVLYFSLEQDLQFPRLTRKHRPVPSRCALKTCPSFPCALTRDDLQTDSSEDQQQQRCNLVWQNAQLDQLVGMNQSSGESGAVAGSAALVLHEKADLDKTLLVLMKTACASDEPTRALDLARCLRLKKSFGIAQKLASHFGFRQLLHQLYELYAARYDHQEQPDHHHQQQQQQQSQQRMGLPRQRAAPRRSSHRSQPQAHENQQEENEEEQEEVQPAPKRTRVDDEQENLEPSPTQQPQQQKQLLKKARREQSSNQAPKKPHIQFDQAPVNPFAKKSTSSSDKKEPAEAAAASSGTNSGASTPVKKKKRSVMERLALFQSPPAGSKRG